MPNKGPLGNTAETAAFGLTEETNIASETAIISGIAVIYASLLS